jgi:hypothetical protein
MEDRLVSLTLGEIESEYAFQLQSEPSINKTRCPELPCSSEMNKVVYNKVCCRETE